MNINLELTEEQAKLLSWLLASVGGDSQNSGRRVTDEIAGKLWEVNMGYDTATSEQFPFEENEETIRFK